MKAIIFAGGVGTRLWPLSRKKSPKQFEKIIGNKSTLQLTIERLIPHLAYEDIYISTGVSYVDVVKKQLPSIPSQNIIGEPVKKDVGPAVCVMMGMLAKKFPNEPVIILWSDHMVKNQSKFKEIISLIEAFIKKNPDKIVFIGQKPRFASENLGWIEMGETIHTEETVNFKKFLAFKYKPDKELAEKYLKDGRYCWNLGYFVSTPKFIYELFMRFSPHIYRLAEDILASRGTETWEKDFKMLYEQMPEINFDNAVLEQLDNNLAYVVVEDIGWSDVGAWEALKEAMEQTREDNITNGKVLLEDSFDNLIYNYNQGTLLVGVDLQDILVVNTKDVLLVAKKSSVSKIKKMVAGFEGTEHENLT